MGVQSHDLRSNDLTIMMRLAEGTPCWISATRKQKTKKATRRLAGRKREGQEQVGWYQKGEKEKDHGEGGEIEKEREMTRKKERGRKRERRYGRWKRNTIYGHLCQSLVVAIYRQCSRWQILI